MADLESDFSVFHRVDDMLSLPASKFFRLAERLPAYEGIMRVRVEAEMRREQDRHGGVTPVALTPERLADPTLFGLIEYAQVDA